MLRCAFLIPFACFGLGRALTTIPLAIAVICALIGGDIKEAFNYLKTNKFSFETDTEKVLLKAFEVAKKEGLNDNIENDYNTLISNLNKTKTEVINEDRTKAAISTSGALPATDGNAWCSDTQNRSYPSFSHHCAIAIVSCKASCARSGERATD